MTYDKDYQDYRADSKSAKCKSKKMLLECGEGTGSRTFTSSDDTPFTIAFVTVDTTCLDKPEVLIKFSSLVKVERLVEGATVILRYELLRMCEDEDPVSLGTWDFEKVDISNTEFGDAAEESFNFIFCDCFTCPDCCHYFVKVTPIEILDITVKVSNGRMAALTQPLNDCSKSKINPSDSKDTVLACGNGNGSTVLRTGKEEPVRIANVEVDTSGLCKPKVLVEFSSIVNNIEIDSAFRFRFELFRVCGYKEPISLGSWTYKAGEIGGNTQVAQGFGFTFCECVNFSGCFEYFVILTPVEVPIEVNGITIISNIRMTAVAQSSKHGDRIYDTIDCNQKNIKSEEILLECGSSTGSRTFTSSNDSPFQLAQVTIDTTGLCNPMVNIEFSSIVSFDRGTGDLEAFVRYQLFKVCDDGRPESQGVWVVLRSDQDIDKITQSFDFTFCEHITCKSSCCIYFVKVTPLEVANGQVTVSNGRIAALVQGG